MIVVASIAIVVVLAVLIFAWPFLWKAHRTRTTVTERQRKEAADQAAVVEVLQHFRARGGHGGFDAEEEAMLDRHFHPEHFRPERHDSVAS
jgi:hypothetical protein